MSKVNAYIDGAFFQDGVRGQGMSMRMDLKALVEELAGDGEVGEIHYFMNLSSEVQYPNRRKNDEKLMARYEDQGLIVHIGRTEQKAQVFVDRGVDTRLSAKMMADAYADKFDTALVISRRPDLEPAITAVREAGKTVNVSFFRFVVDPTNELEECCDNYAVLTNEQVIRHKIEGPQPNF